MADFQIDDTVDITDVVCPVTFVKAKVALEELDDGQMAERIHAGDFDSKVLADGTFALVDFYSDSCVPCKRMSPVLAELEESYAGKLYIGKVNIAYEPELVEKYEVSSAPTLVFFKDGKEIQRLTGVQKKADLEKFISENV